METPTPYFNPFDPEFRANPYPHYQRLLQAPPLRYSGGISAIVISRYNDVQAVLRDPETFSNHRPERTPFRQLDLTGDAVTMLGADPPVHTRLRKLVSRDFTPRRIAAMTPRITEITTGLLDEVAAKGEFDAMADLANQLPVLVIAEMLGIPTERHREFKSWSDAIIASSAIPPFMPRPPEAIDATKSMKTFLEGEIERRRSLPGPDLISALIASQEAEVLSAGELLAFLILLLLAGNETTTNLIGNGLLALGRYSDQRELLRNDPLLIGSAIEEMLRFDSPVQGTIRVAKQAVKVSGVEIEPGTLVIALIAAANRDPSVFARPEVFDVARDPNEHIAFGYGIHFCIGAPLARLEGEIAISAVLERFPRFALANSGSPLNYKGSLFLRGLSALPMKVS